MVDCVNLFLYDVTLVIPLGLSPAFAGFGGMWLVSEWRRGVDLLFLLPLEKTFIVEFEY